MPSIVLSVSYTSNLNLHSSGWQLLRTSEQVSKLQNREKKAMRLDHMMLDTPG